MQVFELKEKEMLLELVQKEVTLLEKQAAMLTNIVNSDDNAYESQHKLMQINLKLWYYEQIIEKVVQ